MSEKLSAERHTPDELTQELEALDLEIVRFAVICQVRLFDPGVLNQVMDNNEQICGQFHPTAFQSLRGLLYLHFDMHRQLAQTYGTADAEEIIHRVREHLRPRIGEQLGSLFNTRGAAD
ncbi:hypothetical protein G5S34_13435 [Herbaspirillum frisingense]|uniref:hypothetical protein n=1 Tax=Herbaspirillum frisingense TaxID=92645 RepID=UPI0016024245|nr:hypothetical protein [Herbaspirillum frisingense]QNB07670.1 hypothetical protein G5S34_13435 [Herbaspirillum frisingense]